MSVEIDVDDLHKFRNVSELNEDPEGGFLEGKIKFNGIPNDAVIKNITLTLVKFVLKLLK